MNRSYYSDSVAHFLSEEATSVMGKLSIAHPFSLTDLQKNAWLHQIQYFQRELSPFRRGHIIFEFSIPRMGKRVDNVLILDGVVFVVEFKVGEVTYHRHDLDQVLDYSLDLKNFHYGSRDVAIIPILLATDAPPVDNAITRFPDKVWAPLKVNADSFAQWVRNTTSQSSGPPIDPRSWENSEYRPTPTIIEAARVLYQGHSVDTISRSDAANLGSTTDAVSSIIERAKSGSTKAICFVTGVPGSGKTLAGLNLASERLRADLREHAVFLSGNGPLVSVLQEALARSEVESTNGATKKPEALAKAKTFIQIIHYFRDDALVNRAPPVEKVVIFDEAQRAWTLEKTRQFMAQKKGVTNFSQSEPEFLIDIMDRHRDWSVIVCLIGGGQEINTGEAGLPEWFRALGTKFRDWDVYVSDQLTEYEYDQGGALYAAINPTRLKVDRRLHLATSIRSFRSENVSRFVKATLDLRSQDARELKIALGTKYPIFLTRSISAAKKWVRSAARGTERFGLVSSSGAHRLRPFGITVKAKVDPQNWFLNEATDVRSSYYLEEVATEFDIQGLELDFAIVGWDADLRYANGEWEYLSFRGTEWNRIIDPLRRGYLKNAYRVLLTRARQGMIIFIPEGDRRDRTRIPEYYDGTCDYLRRIGIEEIG